MSEAWRQPLRDLCLALPGAEETGGVGSPSYKVRGKIFAMQHGMDGRPSLWCKAPPGMQAALVQTHPERYFVPPYVGGHGWVGLWLDDTPDWAEIEDLVLDSYRMTAPKRLSAQLPERD